MAKRPMTARNLRRLRQRGRATTSQLWEMYEFVEELQNDLREQIEERTEHEKKLEKEAKEKGAKEAKEETWFKKKFTFGQMLFWIFVTQGVLMLTWGSIFAKLMR